MQNRNTQQGFTLIEVVVALTILSWVLGSVLFLVSQYADERIMMRERFYGNQVAWNQMMENYQLSRGWSPLGESNRIELSGEEEQDGQTWFWQMNITRAMGRNLFRYETRVAAESEQSSASTLVMYLLGAEGEQP
ncbi:MAG: type II secretion system protein GspI [Gammaproteobacteria bacterium]|nr:type II secretion system protein GspI [Gammaproteobacteria bacterium]MAY02364.1 type II secretion system protein GspI [Gammaproteobacteria bacterium]|tara:strand:- start:389 stop:793 length:405 start_codon:yes stop_codon:yes gene_type:complete